MAVLSPYDSSAYSSCDERGYSLVAVLRLLIAVASLVAQHRLQDSQVSVVAAHVLCSCISQALEHRLNGYGSQASLLRGIWDLPGQGMEPMSPALAGGFFTTETPGKSLIFC